jgi:two-component system phosphate regulon sensor histidine kinase PhoR
MSNKLLFIDLLKDSVFKLSYLEDKIKENDISHAEEYLADAIFDLKKLDLYVEKIQEISQGEDSMIDLSKDKILLETFFLKLKEKQELLDEKKIHVSLHIEKDLKLETDRLHFSNIIENLMENSIKYSDESVCIEITAFRKDNRIQIVHRDNGWGISPSEINYIFDPFYRGMSKKKRKQNGFGLGLSYIKIMMKNMNGTISVNSKEDEFTEFTLLFPI